LRLRVFHLVPALWCMATPSVAASVSASVAAMENRVSLAVGAAYTSYGAHSLSGGGESGALPSVTLGAAMLRPAWPGIDYYAALSYRFSAGSLGTSAGGTDRAAFNSAEARLGAGLGLPDGAEIIPYLAIGYQSWNRILTAPGAGAAFYASPLAGAGTRLDMPVTNRLVVSLGAEFLALAGGTISSTMPGTSLATATMGVTPETHIELGLDSAAYGALHLFAQAWWTHFTYAGTTPSAPYGQSAPFSATDQEGVNLGIGYRFY
jgi:hypothetical protein